MLDYTEKPFSIIFSSCYRLLRGDQLRAPRGGDPNPETLMPCWGGMQQRV
jgi:hypothetical protein